ncbi:hypothetical protein Ancab_017283 [Ancistrocladus abbreviatus]
MNGSVPDGIKLISIFKIGLPALGKQLPHKAHLMVDFGDALKVIGDALQSTRPKCLGDHPGTHLRHQTLLIHKHSISKHIRQWRNPSY